MTYYTRMYYDIEKHKPIEIPTVHMCCQRCKRYVNALRESGILPLSSRIITHANVRNDKSIEYYENKMYDIDCIIIGKLNCIHCTAVK